MTRDSAADDHSGECHNNYSHGYQEGELVTANERAISVDRTGGSNGGERGEPNGLSDLLSGGEEPAGQAALTRGHSGSDGNGWGGEYETHPKGGEEQSPKHIYGVGTVHVDLG